MKYGHLFFSSFISGFLVMPKAQLFFVLWVLISFFSSKGPRVTFQAVEKVPVFYDDLRILCGISWPRSNSFIHDHETIFWSLDKILFFDKHYDKYIWWKINKLIFQKKIVLIIGNLSVVKWFLWFHLANGQSLFSIFFQRKILLYHTVNRQVSKMHSFINIRRVMDHLISVFSWLPIECLWVNWCPKCCL